MQLRLAKAEEFENIKRFYWELIDLMLEQNDTIGWKKGIYPTDEFLIKSLNNKELYVIENKGIYIASVILNSECNDGYFGLPWQIECDNDDVLIPHALAVHPNMQGQGVGKTVVSDIIEIAKNSGKKVIRLDILGTNKIAERLYTVMGFQFIKAENMFYEDTGWTEYKMFELILK